MEICYKFRLYPNATQEKQIQRTFGSTRYIYNYFLSERKRLYEEKKETLNYFACSSELTKLKHDGEHDWLNEIDSRALKASLKDLDVAYQNFFRGIKKGQKVGYPHFKSKKDRNKSYRTNNTTNTIRVVDNAIRLPKLGNVKCKVSRSVQGRILNATVSQTPSGKYFVSVCCTDVVIPQYPHTGKSIGLDMGLTDFAVSSDGTRYANPKYLSKSEKRLALLQRRLSRKQKGSNNREKARIAVAKLHERIANQRRDNLQKLSTQLVKDNDVIATESLNVKGMEQNHSLAKSIADASWSEFERMLTYKTAWHGKELIKIDRFFPSSQLCSMCGYRNTETKDLSVRKWICPDCGTVHDRDENAAKNILAEAIKVKAL